MKVGLSTEDIAYAFERMSAEMNKIASSAESQDEEARQLINLYQDMLQRRARVQIESRDTLDILQEMIDAL